MRKLLVSLALFALSAASSAEDYLVTQLRAAPGNLPKLLDLIDKTDWANMPGGRPIVMRHSQGNHWDIMLLVKNDNCNTKACATFAASIDELADFKLQFTAHSETDWKAVSALDANSGLYHIEMFQAGAGKHNALMRQRVIENDYIERIGGRANTIFTVGLGSDFDIFTIGFYESLEAYAKPDPATVEEKEAAAKAAGFKDRADVSFLLRELIVGHQDTLAVKVPAR